MDKVNEYLAVELFGWRLCLMVHDSHPVISNDYYVWWDGGDFTRPYGMHQEADQATLSIDYSDTWESAGMVIEKMREIGNNELFGEFVCELAEALGATEDDWIIAAHYLMMGLTPETVARAAAAALGMEDEDD